VATVNETPEPPRGFTLVLKGGHRIPCDLKYHEQRPMIGHVWRPVIEGKLIDLMPMIVQLDAEYWPPATHVLFPTWPERGLTHEWMERVMANSPALTQVSARGKTIKR
jgi:hypothetical protein